MASIEKLKRTLRGKDKHTARLSVIYSWIKDDVVSPAQFYELLAYCETVEDVKDREFTAKALSKLKEQANP